MKDTTHFLVFFTIFHYVFLDMRTYVLFFLRFGTTVDYYVKIYKQNRKENMFTSRINKNYPFSGWPAKFENKFPGFSMIFLTK